ncbi:hypothetical protein [uncultured Oxalicibacterium sp.]|uniref:hypothetical protein n=1 Tax=uncultured Oxalicibacterium sp. TaxID=1168540 RepID=UPI0025E66D98|nr:hypothetical protein [uncultured Oxalicibacterium sp.]
MTSFFFSQQANGWQQMIRRSQSGGFFSRLFAWLMLGVMMAVGLLVVVTVLLLSWLLIPVLLYKKRRAMEQMRQKMREAGASYPAYGRAGSQGDVIEGVVKEVEDDSAR